MLLSMNTNVLTIAFFVAVLFVVPYGANAALLYMDPENASVYRGDSITLSLRLDTDEGECINVADIVVEYDSSVRAVDVSRGNSIFNVWVEDPRIDEDNNTISFAGGIPGGYCGRIPGDPRLTNIVAEFVFRSPGFSVGSGNNPVAEIKINDVSQVLLNDGKGTKAPLRLKGATINLLDFAGSSREDNWSDRVNDDDVPPSDFVITLTKEESVFSGKYFIVFNSQDKQSGIDHYEVMEEPFDEFYLFKWGRLDAPWVRSESPYVLKDQTLNSTIRVKAIDKASNETIVTLVPETAIRSMSKGKILTIIFVVSIGIILVAGVIYGLARRRKELIKQYDENENNS